MTVEERRVYLMQRLTRRQITMEEATELFSLMNQEVQQLRRRAAALAAAPPPSPTPSAMGESKSAAPSPSRVPGAPTITLGLEEFMLLSGPFLGMLAAILKKGTVPASPSDPPANPTAPSPKGDAGTPRRPRSN